MKPLVCDMCGSDNVVRDGDLFVCRLCGTKFTIETAKKMMFEGTVEVTGAVKTNKENEVDNFIKRSYIALEDGELKDAIGFAEQILNLDAENGEAYFIMCLCDFHANNIENLGRYVKNNVESNRNFKKAKKFADEKLKEKLELLEKEFEYVEALDIFEHHLESEEDFNKAKNIFTQLNGYKESNKWLSEIEEKRKKQIKKCTILEEQRKELKKYQNLIALNYWQCVGIDENREVVRCQNTCYYADGKDVSSWKDIIDICLIERDVIGLKKNGTVVCTSDKYDVSSWKGIKAIRGSGKIVFGLKKDGTVVSTNGCYDFPSWDVVEISVSERNSYSEICAGLRKDGTVVYYDGEGIKHNISSWENIVSIYCSDEYILGICKDGTILRSDNKRYFYRNVVEVTDRALLLSDGTVIYADVDYRYKSFWEDIISIRGNKNIIVGLRSNGTVICNHEELSKQVSPWRKIVAIYFGDKTIVGLCKDGTVCSTSNYYDEKMEDLKLLYTKKEKVEIKKKEKYREAGLCQYCGGKFKGFFIKTCSACGKKKDY